MSDALSYLLKARPEAMQSYFRFIKQAGRHLDPKTRALISVITKVANQTEAGFRQYLTRALQAGASADEVLDALLVAFPVLGLSKVIWAVEILLTLDLPEFRPEGLGGEAAWHDAGALQDLPDGQATRLACDGRELFILRDGESLKVYDSRCPHQETNIPVLALEGLTLKCPKHGWVFDLSTGDCIAQGDRPLRRFEHRLEAGRLLVFW